jgi:hypothetical protein
MKTTATSSRIATMTPYGLMYTTHILLGYSSVWNAGKEIYRVKLGPGDIASEHADGVMAFLELARDRDLRRRLDVEGNIVK